MVTPIRPTRSLLAYTITPLTGVLGTDFSNNPGNNTISGNSIVGNVTFGNTSTSATIPVNIQGNPAYGTETFLVTLGNATPGNNTRYAFLTGNISETITINDPRTETIGAGGISGDGNGKVSFAVAATSPRRRQPWVSRAIPVSMALSAVRPWKLNPTLQEPPPLFYWDALTFNLAADSTNYLAPTDPVAQINQVTLNLTSESFSYGGNGTFNVWIVPNTTAANPLGNTTSLIFDKTNDPTEGLGQQLVFSRYWAVSHLTRLRPL